VSIEPPTKVQPARETAEAGASRATLVRNLLDGHYEDPVRIVTFNTVEGWSRDRRVALDYSTLVWGND
jgi:hypothetical protein